MQQNREFFLGMKELSLRISESPKSRNQGVELKFPLPKVGGFLEAIISPTIRLLDRPPVSGPVSLRHTVAVILRECGFDERTIADALGQRTIEMARHYAKGADLTEKMRAVSKTFEREVNRRRTKVSNPSMKASNLGVNSK